MKHMTVTLSISIDADTEDVGVALAYALETGLNRVLEGAMNAHPAMAGMFTINSITSDVDTHS